MKIPALLAIACALSLSACGPGDNKPKSDTAAKKTPSSVGDGTAASPKAPLQTGEATGKGSDAAGGGTTTGARSTPDPK
jgi:hypothetical protein